MTNLINDFLSQPLWLSIPLVMVYLALLAYFLYILWHYRRNTLSAVLLTVALFVGQKAAADSDISYGGKTYTIFDSEGYYTATDGSEVPSACTYEYLVDNVIVPSLYGLPYTYTYWLTEDENGFETKFIEFYSANPIVPKGYRLRTACNTNDHPNRRPKSWTLKGKKHADDAQWTILATETNAQLPKENEEKADYWLTDNTAPYQYFRFEVTDIQGSEKIPVSTKVSYTRWRMELSQLQIIGNNYSADNDIDYATISGLQHYYKYTGSDITPTFTVKDMSGTALTAGTDYTVSYSCNGNSVTTVNATGTYTLTITGTGSYTGQQTASFKVYQALAGNGTETDPYIIADANDWYVFGKYIYENWSNTEGKYYKLANDFDNSNEPITEMIATTKKDANDPTKLIHTPFCGTLDGNGRTLHIALKANSDDGCAPFRYLKKATIKDLTVAGYAATSAKFGASIAVDNLNDGDNMTEITDCYSRVTIASSKEGDGTNGGFVAVNHGKLKFSCCAFLGRMLGSTAESNGGFVGWNDNGAKSLNFYLCIFDPVRVTMSETGSKTFSRYDTNAPTYNAAYFTYTEWGTNQGTQAVALTTAPANLGNVKAINGKMKRYEHGLECDGIFYVTNLGFYDDANNNVLLREANGRRVNVTLTGRTLFKDGNWNALCLPFNLGSDYVANFLGNGGKLMELDTEGEYATNRAPAENGTSQTGFDPATGTLRLYFKEATEIKAGTPYIIKWPNGGNNLTDHKFQSVKIDNSDATLIRQSVESADGRVLFSGTFSPVELPVSDKSNLFFASGNEDQSVLGYPTDGNNDDTANPKYLVKSFRAFFHVDLSDGASINAIELHAGDETTGVKNVQCSMFSVQSSDAWFDLQGRRLAGKPSRAGAYINNGKKIVIK